MHGAGKSRMWVTAGCYAVVGTVPRLVNGGVIVGVDKQTKMESFM